jgi:hypothetical protein
METATLGLDSRAFVNALEQVLPRRGYRVVRSFELSFTDTSQADEPRAALQLHSCECGCGYTVIQVFSEMPATLWAGAIAVQGREGRTTVSLTSPENDSDLAAQFASVLIEIVQRSDS